MGPIVSRETGWNVQDAGRSAYVAIFLVDAISFAAAAPEELTRINFRPREF